jgi:hypothetical protein
MPALRRLIQQPVIIKYEQLDLGRKGTVDPRKKILYQVAATTHCTRNKGIAGLDRTTVFFIRRSFFLFAGILLLAGIGTRLFVNLGKTVSKQRLQMKQGQHQDE